MDYITFGVVIDDVVFPDGQSIGGLLGGGGPQTAFGMRQWSARVGLIGRVGADMPSGAWAWLRAMGIDCAGVRTTTWPTLRATQRLGADGSRRHEWQVPAGAVAAQLARSADDVPAAYRAARGWHLGVHPEEPPLDFLAALRALGGVVSVETFRPALARPSAEALRALLATCHIFSPNARGAESLVGPGTPEAQAARLLDAGAAVVALRLGAAGSLVAEARGGQCVRIPATPVTVIDPVGAGNAYCGGFLTGWVETSDLIEAGLRGSVAASFMLEQFGLPPPGREAEAQARVEALRAAVVRLTL